MYKQVAKMQPVAREYEAQLISEGVVTNEEIKGMKAKIAAELESAYGKSKTLEFEAEQWQSAEWVRAAEMGDDEAQRSGVPVDRLRDVGEKISVLPPDEGGKTFHRLVRKIFEQRHKSITTGAGIDWGTAEALAFSTLIQDGFQVRISGQDVERGTFSHRHAHVFYQDTDGYYNPINNAVVTGATRKFIASNSHLSEFAVLGYELGYAQTHPNTLTLWEAQFGDFVNGAQIIIDQFLCSGEAKWNVENGLVVLLPHGYDGNGPEHSSCRTERFLLLCDQDDSIPANAEYNDAEVAKEANMHVAHPSTAANYFHLLRRHQHRTFRKPLIVVAPKKLLRYRGATSSIEEFAENKQFTPVFDDQSSKLVKKDKVRKVLLCAGQVYFDLEEKREKEGHNDVAILRVESLCPFPFREAIAALK